MEALMKPDKSWQRKILAQAKAWKAEEYFVYFLLFKLRGWGKRFAAQPQAVSSEFP